MTLNGKVVAFGAALALTACGGGNSSSGRTIGYTGKTTVVAITDSNALTVAGSASTASGATGSSTVGYVGAVKATPAALSDRALAFVTAVPRRDQWVSATAILRTASATCDLGGTMEGSWNDQDGNQNTWQTGDWIQIVYNQCKETDQTTGQTVLVNGSVRLDVTATQNGILPSPSALTTGMTTGTYGMKLTAVNFSVEDTTTGDWWGMTGDLAYSITWDGTYLTSTAQGSGIAMEAGNGSTVTAASLLAGAGGTGSYQFQEIHQFTYNSTYGWYDHVSDSFGVTARMCNLDIDGCLDLVISPALRKLTADTYPSSGDLTVTGQSGAYVEISVIDNTNVTITYDVDGTGPTAPVTITPVPWTCLESHVNCPP